jgi:gliding motility-associated-like protein
MRYIHTIIGFLAIAFFSCLNNIVCAQDIKPSVGKFLFTPFKTGTYNFDSFTLQYKRPTTEWKLHNKESLNHPDAGFITRDNPANAIEILAKRTYNSRYFIDKDTSSKFYIVQSNTDINYLKDGQWLTIDKRVSPQQKNKYEASRQPEPVGFDLANKISYIKTFSGPVYFNNWRLIGQNGDSSTLLAIADWSRFSVGDDGIKITDVFPGIDAQMIVDKGSIKTNFIVKQNEFKGYEQLIFTDEFKGDKAGGTLAFSDQDEKQGGVDFMVDKKPLVHVNSALMYVENKPASTTETINYNITNNQLSLLVNGNDLNNKLAMGTVLIDPLVASADSLPMTSIGGSMNDGNIGLSCNYNLVMTTPAKATFTSIYFQFGFNTYAPANNSMGAIAIDLGTCNSGGIGTNPTDTNYLKPGYASTMGIWNPISNLVSCLPPPACSPQTVTFVLQFFNSAPFGPDGVCSDEYVSPHEAFQILITGYTLQMDSTVLKNGVSFPATICQTSNTTLSAEGIYGVPPYSYAWNNGAGNGSSVSVSPSVTTNYTVIVTDQCGNTATGSTLVTVIPQVTPSITIRSSDTTACAGTSVTFSAVPTNGGPTPSYQWKLNGSNVGANSTNYTNNTWVNGDQVSCVLTSDANCVSTSTAVSDTITMIVPMSVTPLVSIAASANDVCGDVPITFSAVPVNAGPSPFYQWQVNGINVGSNDSLYTSDSLVDGDIVSCIVSVSSTGCYTNPTATSNSLAMDIKPIPAIVLAASKMVIPIGETTQLNAVITGGYSSFIWAPTTGLNDPSITTPIANPLISTTYLIDVTDTDGCVRSDSILIGVYDPIIMPNAFTPNGDGLNEYFRIPPTITGFNLTNFAIYNRWGEMIFETSDISPGWDGTFQGNPCDIGTYIYVITGSNAKGKVFLKGCVSLFR